MNLTFCEEGETVNHNVRVELITVARRDSREGLVRAIATGFIVRRIWCSAQMAWEERAFLLQKPIFWV